MQEDEIFYCDDAELEECDEIEYNSEKFDFTRFFEQEYDRDATTPIFRKDSDVTTSDSEDSNREGAYQNDYPDEFSSDSEDDYYYY